MKLTKYIKVKVGSYVKDGETKGKYQTVGRVLEDSDGEDMILLDRTFNPAGVPTDRESIILNFWDAEKKEDSQEAQPQASRRPAPIRRTPDLDDEIPF